ncbi:hypothetical protein AB0N07_28495 [Streptomyces sp. NPDC051172]
MVISTALALSSGVNALTTAAAVSGPTRVETITTPTMVGWSP